MDDRISETEEKQNNKKRQNQEETQSKRAGKSNAGNIWPAWGRQTEITK